MRSPFCRPVRVNKKILIDLIGIELLVLVVVLGYKLSPHLLPQADIQIEPDAACSLLERPCHVSLPDGGRIELSLGNRPVPLLKPFSLQVKADNLTVDRVTIDFAGVDMNMGYNRSELQAGDNGVFSGQATLPLCVTGSMLWQATVLIDSGRRRIAIPYRFSTGLPA